MRRNIECDWEHPCAFRKEIGEESARLQKENDELRREIRILKNFLKGIQANVNIALMQEEEK